MQVLASPTKLSIPLPPPEDATLLPRASRAIGALAFVDRDSEAYTIALANLRNKKRRADKPTLVTAGQLYGAGKSKMGEHAVDRIRVTKELQLKLVKEGKQEASDVEDYANAVSITVDLSKYSADTFSTLEMYLAYALYASIRKSEKHKPAGWPVEVPSFAEPLAGVAELFIKLSERSLFIHWDEVFYIWDCVFFNASFTQCYRCRFCKRVYLLL